jgi:hypothetical protein
MDELKKLRELAEKASNGGWLFHVSALQKAATPTVILSLLERLEKAEADAKRYRFLRAQMRDASSDWYVHSAPDTPQEIDAQLDKQEKQ